MWLNLDWRIFQCCVSMQFLLYPCFVYILIVLLGPVIAAGVLLFMLSVDTCLPFSSNMNAAVPNLDFLVPDLWPWAFLLVSSTSSV